MLQCVGDKGSDYYSINEKHTMRDAVLSQTPSDVGGLGRGETYFTDTGYVPGKPYGLSECKDEGPRSFVGFGLVVNKIPDHSLISTKDILKTWRAKMQSREYHIKNPRRFFRCTTMRMLVGMGAITKMVGIIVHNSSQVS